MERLLRARTKSRGYLNRSSKTIADLIDKDEVTITEISNALKEFTTYLDNVTETQNLIEDNIEESELEETIEEAFSYKQGHLTIKNKAEILLTKLESKTNVSLDNDVKHVSKVQANLPKLEIQKFSGNYLEFQTFYGKFTAVIDHSDLPPISKFTYLQSLLTGDALASIKGLSVTEENYPVAKSIIEKRFGRKERIIFTHIQKLLTLQVDFRKSNGLWHLFDQLQTHIRCLESLGIGSDQFGAVLTPVVLSRIPEEIRLQWARVGEGKESDLSFLLDFLYDEIKTRERSETFHKSEDQRKVKATTPMSSAAAFHVFAQDKKSSNSNCKFCNKNSKHRSENCYSIRNMSPTELGEKVKEKGLCFICFGSHFKQNCQSKKTCEKCNNGFHHSLLCRDKRKTEEVRAEVDNLKIRSNDGMNKRQINSGDNSPFPSNIMNYTHNNNRATIMPVAKTSFETSAGKFIDINVLFDSGSDRSFITTKLASKLQLKRLKNEYFSFSGFGGFTSSANTKRNIYCLQLDGIKTELAEIDIICNSMFRTSVPFEKLNDFCEIKFTENYSQNRSIDIDILIGLDYLWQMVTNDMKRVNSLVAQRTRLGWILSGQYKCRNKTHTGAQLLCLEPLSESMVRTMWDIETLGIKGNGQPIVSDPIMTDFSENITYENGRYCVGLPWNEKQGKLLNNKSLAEKRLNSLFKRLEAQPDLKNKYNENIKEMEETGIISQIKEPADNKGGPIFYLPHRPVVKEQSKTTKVRPVFDGSAKGFNGVSLNDCLETGPNLLPNLLEVLLRFRRWKYAVTGDVTKAFLQVSIKESDRNALQFLWIDEGVIKTMAFNRVPFGTKSSPFLLNATIKHHLENYPQTPTVLELKDNMYVDDLLSGADTINDACQLIKESRQIMSKAGMTLTKWSSNSTEVADATLKNFDVKLDVDEATKVLGLKWNPNTDSFSFHGLAIPKDITINKRTVLSLIARLFDPIGFITPVIITGKILFQELWSLGIEWDTALPDELEGSFIKWVEEIEQLQQWEIPRCIVKSSWQEATDVELHIFCDASEKGYGCCAYLREKSGNNINVSLITSKARVAPLKRLTLPRLELVAAVLGARLKEFIIDTLRLPQKTKYKCYTDSMITLQWIKGDSNRWKTFVANRVQEIQNLTDPSCWFHCAGSNNPADLMTRGIKAKQLMSSSLWLNGPEWLSKEEQINPYFICNEVYESPITGEERQPSQCIAVEKNKTSVIEIERFSSLSKPTRILGWVLRFIARCRRKKQNDSNDLTNDEMLTASHKLVWLTQNEHFTDEIKLLQGSKQIHKSSTISKLRPFIGNDGLLRATCRLNYSQLTYDEKYPVILPKCHFSSLLVREAHISHKHAGVNQMIANIRNLYWIVGLRGIARKIKSQCLPCKYLDARACQEPIAPLMEDRLKRAPPFTIVGIDFTGAVYCKDFPNKKYYILLFTCCVIRAIHLELVESLSLPTFMLAFRRFASRRGLPSTIYSDNALTFRSASTALWKQYGSNSPKWRFSVPRAPWWGGWWERLIKNTKGALKKSIGTRCLDKTELETTLVEIEGCINSRPLTFVGDSIENGHPLTPSHFLLGRGSYLNKVNIDETCLSLDGNKLTEDLSHIDIRLSMFWEKWQNEYLKQLPLPKLRDKVGNLVIGSIVLIREDNVPRLYWPMGIVEDMIKGRDGVYRTVKVKTKRGSFTRPIQRIHDLELNASINNNFVIDELENNTENRIGEVKSKFGRVIKPPKRF